MCPLLSFINSKVALCFFSKPNSAPSFHHRKCLLFPQSGFLKNTIQMSFYFVFYSTEMCFNQPAMYFYIKSPSNILGTTCQAPKQVLYLVLHLVQHQDLTQHTTWYTSIELDLISIRYLLVYVRDQPQGNLLYSTLRDSKSALHICRRGISCHIVYQLSSSLSL